MPGGTGTLYRAAVVTGFVPVLIAEGVSRRFGEKWVLKGVDLHLQPGRLVVVAGRSGSGKSTLFSVLSGLEAPSSGRVLYEGRDLAGMGETQRTEFRLRHLGVVFQDFRLLPDLTALENVALPLVLARRGRSGADRRSLSNKQVRARAFALLERFALQELADRFPETISGGEQQRVAVARALANDPGVVLADEPTANLDEQNAHAVMAMLKKAAQSGRVVWVAAHDPVARGYADELYQIQAGGLVKGSLPEASAAGPLG